MEDVRRGTRLMCVQGYDTHPGQIRQHPINPALVSFPKTGMMYTVREVKQYTGGAAGLLLLEVQNPAVKYPGWGMHEPCWDPARFEVIETS